MKNLYRPEAFESRIKGFSNPVSIKGSLAVHVMLAGIALVAAGLIAYGALTDFTRRAEVGGFLRPGVGSVGVTATRAGRLLLEVRNGQKVKEGQRLARIQGDDLDATGQSLLELQITGLKDAQRLVVRRLDLARFRARPLKEQSDLALAQHQRDIELTEKRVASLREQLEIVRAEVQRNDVLAEKGLVPQSIIQEIRGRLIDARQAMSEAESKLNTLHTQTEQLNIDWKVRQIDLEESINTLEQEERNLEAQIIQARARRETGLFAPIGGTITFSLARAGETVATGTSLFQITPEDAALQAVLLAPSSAVGFVKPGDTVQIRYDAFPYLEHGVFQGVIREIDETAQFPAALGAPITVSGPTYRIVAEIPQEPQSKTGQLIRLAPGMTLQASIVIDRKPLLLWLLTPVL